MTIRSWVGIRKGRNTAISILGAAYYFSRKRQVPSPVLFLNKVGRPISQRPIELGVAGVFDDFQHKKDLANDL